MSLYTPPENWDHFIIKEVVMGGVRKKVKFDQENNIIYLLNDLGEWTGEKAAWAKPANKQKPAQNDKEQDPDAEQDKEANASEDEETPPLPKPAKRKKSKQSKLTPTLIVIIAIMAVLLVLQNNTGGLFQKSYEVIIAMENIQPGESVKGKLSSVTISFEEYQRYTADGGLYNADDYTNIKEFVATSFIPQDGYISYSNISETFQATNPWMLSNTDSTITIPIDITNNSIRELVWGKAVTVTINASKKISSEDSPNATRPSPADVSNSSTTQTIQIDHYTLADTVIVDVLNSTKTSLYSDYAAMAAIPEKYRDECLTARYGTESQIYSDLPAYIKVKVSSETAEWWKSLSKASYDFDFTIAEHGIYCETPLQNETHLALMNIIPYVQSAWDAAQED